MFGMGVARIRPTNRSSIYIARDNKQYSAYKTRIDSVKDLAMWFEYTGFPEEASSPEDYARLLKLRGYYTDSESNYANSLRYYYDRQIN
jgi:hypothetical protein